MVTILCGYKTYKVEYNCIGNYSHRILSKIEIVSLELIFYDFMNNDNLLVK